MAYYVVVVPEFDYPKKESFLTLDQVIKYLKTLNNTNVQVFVFEGEALAITKGRNKYLVTEDGDSYPLFDTTPESMETDENGWLGQEAHPKLTQKEEAKRIPSLDSLR